MTASEILRKMADIIDGRETGNDPAVTTQDIENRAQVNTRSMVAPLQQKLELIKKVAGVDGAFANGELNTDAEESGCTECGSAPCECEDEMSILRRNAGIAPVVVAMADEDEPFEG